MSILWKLKGSPHIIELQDLIVDEATHSPSLVFEYLQSPGGSMKDLYPTFNPYDVKWYIYQILLALEDSHSKGIMHWDIKPLNVIVNPHTWLAKVIDWGLAEYYLPGTDYHVWVASRYYKGPELMTNNTKYHYSLDIWGVGCMLAEMTFKREPFFKGKDNHD